jgi:GAF domain-containing protein
VTVFVSAREEFDAGQLFRTLMAEDGELNEEDFANYFHDNVDLGDGVRTHGGDGIDAAAVIERMREQADTTTLSATELTLVMRTFFADVVQEVIASMPDVPVSERAAIASRVLNPTRRAPLSRDSPDTFANAAAERADVPRAILEHVNREVARRFARSPEQILGELARRALHARAQASIVNELKSSASWQALVQRKQAVARENKQMRTSEKLQDSAERATGDDADADFERAPLPDFELPQVRVRMERTEADRTEAARKRRETLETNGAVHAADADAVARRPRR